jgi:hypothetical protein
MLLFWVNKPDKNENTFWSSHIHIGQQLSQKDWNDGGATAAMKY